jgi:catechol 2,3-dioxygenase-like lactoylglutathione lyase family enzyme
MKRFYANVLGLDIKESDSNHFTVNVGETDLTFQEAEEPSFYHFAINIPGNQFSIMKQWIKEKVPLNRSRGLTEVYYESLGADSMYFEDPAGNMVELIGRRNRDLFGPLTKEAFINVSEVGIISPHLYDVGEELQDLGLPLVKRAEVNPEEVNFLGKEDAYIILAPPGWQFRFSKKEAETHSLQITLKNGMHFSIDKEGRMDSSEEKQE